MRFRSVILNVNLVLLVGSSSIHAQEQDCHVYLDQLLQKEVHRKPDKGAFKRTVLAISYQYREALEYAEAQSKVGVEIIEGNGLYIYHSDHLSLLMDEEDTFVAIHPGQRIVRQASVLSQAMRQRLKQPQMMNLDSLLRDYRLVDCQEKPSSTGELTQLTLRPRNPSVGPQLIREITYLVYARSGRLAAIEIAYKNESEIKSQHIKVVDFDTNYQLQRYPSASAQIFGSDGNLIRKYAAYQFIDKR